MVVTQENANQPKSISKRRLTMAVYQPRNKKPRTELSTSSAAEPQIEETGNVSLTSEVPNSNQTEKEGSVSVSDDAFKPVNCSTCHTKIFTEMERKYHEKYHKTNRCILCKAFINERLLFKHFHICLLCSDRFSNDELLIYMTPCRVKIPLLTPETPAPAPQDTPETHSTKPSSVKQRKCSTKKNKLRIRLRMVSSSSESEDTINGKYQR